MAADRMARMTKRRHAQLLANWQRNDAAPFSFPTITQKELLRLHPRLNIGQVLVWIATHNRAAVAEACDQQNGPDMGWTVAAVVLADQTRKTGEDSATWIEAALKGLRSGRLKSVGRLQGRSAKILEPFEWDQFSIQLDDSGRWSVEGGEIDSVGVDATDTLREFPARRETGQKKRGAPPLKRSAATAQLVAAVRSGTLSTDELTAMSDKKLVARCGNVGRDTARHAKVDALAELSIPTNSDKK